MPTIKEDTVSKPILRKRGLKAKVSIFSYVCSTECFKAHTQKTRIERCLDKCICLSECRFKAHTQKTRIESSTHNFCHFVRVGFKAHTQKTRIERAKIFQQIFPLGTGFKAHTQKTRIERGGFDDKTAAEAFVSKPILRKRGLKDGIENAIRWIEQLFQSPYSENED